MGKDDKEDSGFGFKDKAKAVDTLRLLEQHDLNYRRLTVRGLLGRAKRVLSMTKAEDKKKNIKEAMAVFEEWIEENSASKTDGESRSRKRKSDTKQEKEKKSDKEESQSDSEPESQNSKKSSDTVPGLGFKDAAAAEDTIKELEGRDPEYQRLAVKGLIGRANRVITCTRDETKISNIKAALKIFEKFLEDYESEHRSKQNYACLSLDVVKRGQEMVADRLTDKQKAFLEAYSTAGGEYKRLRTVDCDGGRTWDIERNKELKTLIDDVGEDALFNDDGVPTAGHLSLISWAYSPNPTKTKQHLSRKRSSDPHDDEPAQKRR